MILFKHGGFKMSNRRLPVSFCFCAENGPYFMYGLHIKNNYVIIGIFLPFFAFRMYTLHIFRKKQVTL